MSEIALNCYVYELFMVINGSCSTNMYARQLSFNFSSMVWGGAWPRGPPPFGSAPATPLVFSELDVTSATVYICYCRIMINEE